MPVMERAATKLVGLSLKTMTNVDTIPDKMTGNDLVKQENYEFGLEKKLVDKYMDRVDRRDKRGEIISFAATSAYRNNYERIFGHK